MDDKEEKRVKINEKQREWREKNREKSRLYSRMYMRAYRANNRETIREYQKQWERDNRSVAARRRGVSKKKGVINFEVKHAEEGKPFIVKFD